MIRLCECGCGKRAPIISKTVRTRGEIAGQPRRFIYGHSLRGGSLSERFWSKVDRRGPDECWPWKGALNSKGYGQIQRGREDGGEHRRVLAHRLAWELTHGPVEPGLLVCHRCDNPPCCNPAHLFLGTASENTHDMLRKGRGFVPTPRRRSALAES